MRLAQWKNLMNQECKDAGHKPGCLNFHVNYTDEKRADDKCTVDDVRPPIGKKVTTSTRVRLKVSCKTSESDTSQNSDTTEKEEGQTDPDTTDEKEDEKDR